MNKPLIIGFAVVAIALFFLPGVVQVIQDQLGDEAAETQGSETNQGGRGDGSPAPNAGQQRQATPQQSAPARQQPAMQPPRLNQQNLANTSWRVPTPMGQFTVDLLPGGQAVARGTPVGDIQGSWRVAGNQLRVEAMNQSINVQISGDQLMHDGVAIQRMR